MTQAIDIVFKNRKIQAEHCEVIDTMRWWQIYDAIVLRRQNKWQIQTIERYISDRPLARVFDNALYSDGKWYLRPAIEAYPL